MSAPLVIGIGTAATLGLAAGAFAYASRWPASQIFGRTLIAPARPGELALTFDDGPNPACTPRLLDILARHASESHILSGGRLCSEASPHSPDPLPMPATWSAITPGATPICRSPRRIVFWKNSRERKILSSKSPANPVRLFRPPFGARRPFVLRTARELGMIPVMWNAMTSDWSERSADRIAAAADRRRSRANHRRGLASNIVLHDGGHLALNTDRGPSIAAAEKLLAQYAPTHKFVTIDAWA